MEKNAPVLAVKVTAGLVSDKRRQGQLSSVTPDYIRAIARTMDTTTGRRYLKSIAYAVAYDRTYRRSGSTVKARRSGRVARYRLSILFRREAIRLNQIKAYALAVMPGTRYDRTDPTASLYTYTRSEAIRDGGNYYSRELPGWARKPRLPGQPAVDTGKVYACGQYIALGGQCRIANRIASAIDG